MKIVLPPRRRASFAKSAERGKRLEKYQEMMENKLKIHPKINKNRDKIDVEKIIRKYAKITGNGCPKASPNRYKIEKITYRKMYEN